MSEDFKKNIIKTGTTILGIVCKDGIVMAADNRATAGNIIMSKTEKKVYPINDYIIMAGCGMAATIQKVPKIIAAELRLKELRSKSRPTVKHAASLLSNVNSMQQAGFLIAGFNEDGTFELYSTDPVGHTSRVEDFDANFGSGMPFVLGLLERQYKKGISLKEGVELAREALKSSTQRDSASGNGMDIFTITKNKIEKVVDQKIDPSYIDRK